MIVNGVLACPVCGSTNLHHRRVSVWERFREDGDGIVVDVNGPAVTTRTCARPLIPGRRNGLELEFWCEECAGEDTASHRMVLRILQHKGSTYFEWTPPTETSTDELSRAIGTLGLRLGASRNEVVARVVELMSAIDTCLAAARSPRGSRPPGNRGAA